MQGTSKLPSIVGIKICSDMYWLVTGLIPVEIIILQFLIYRYLSKQEIMK